MLASRESCCQIRMSGGESESLRTHRPPQRRPKARLPERGATSESPGCDNHRDVAAGKPYDIISAGCTAARFEFAVIIPENAAFVHRLASNGRKSSEYAKLRAAARTAIGRGGNVAGREKLKNFSALTGPDSYWFDTIG